MSRRAGPHLPADVTLPNTPLIGAAHLRNALNVSKAVIHLWRAQRGFPRGHREGREVWTVTDALHLWLEAQGVRVAVI